MLRIHEIKRNIGEGPEVIPRRIIKKLNIRELEISDYQLVKESVDARKKTEIKLVYSVDFVPSLPGREVEDTEAFLLAQCRGVKLEKSPDMNYRPVAPGSELLDHPPVIAGFGPCGMFAGLILSELGYKPVIIERGKADRGKGPGCGSLLGKMESWMKSPTFNSARAERACFLTGS